MNRFSRLTSHCFLLVRILSVMLIVLTFPSVYRVDAPLAVVLSIMALILVFLPWFLQQSVWPRRNAPGSQPVAEKEPHVGVHTRHLVPEPVGEGHDGSLPDLQDIMQIPECFTGRCLVQIHLRHFIAVRNLLGPGPVQELLRRQVTALRQGLPDDTLLCRDGQDTLLAIFPGTSRIQSAEQCLGLLRNIFHSFSVSDYEQTWPPFTCTAGIVEESLTEARFPLLLLNAGIALQQAQQNGRTAMIFTPDMHERGLMSINIYHHLQSALKHDEFHLVMQPIIRLSNPNPCLEGESLIRWQSPELGDVTPDRFIALAEQTGLIRPLGRWIIETACRELAAAIHLGTPENFKLHINASPLQLQSPAFASHLLSCLRRHQLKGQNLCVEITETAIMENAEEAIRHLTILRESGVSISLDDFGTGYSCLSWLHRLPFDQIKIDRSFVRDMLTDTHSGSVVSAILCLARGFNVSVVAEGVEDEKTATALKNMGCELAQGYYFGRPQRFSGREGTKGQL